MCSVPFVGCRGFRADVLWIDHRYGYRCHRGRCSASHRHSYQPGYRRAAGDDKRASGNYQFVNLVPGQYKIEVEKPGFRRFVREPITVEVQSAVRIDVPMQVGDVTRSWK